MSTDILEELQIAAERAEAEKKVQVFTGELASQDLS